MKVVIGADHAGYQYKSRLIEILQKEGYTIIDKGTFNNQPVDYPDNAMDVAMALLNNEGAKGILICGSAVGVSIAANKFNGIRAGVCHDVYSAHQSVEHDDVNILCIGERVIGFELAREIVLTFLKAQFNNEPRHVRRLNKISNIEEKNRKEKNLLK